MFFQAFAGLIYSLSFKPVGIWFLAPLAIALQVFFIRKLRFPEIQSFIFAFSSGLIILSWSRTFVGVLPWIALSILQGILAIPIGIVARFTSRFSPIAFVVLLMEEVRARFPFGGFSWTRIAFSQVESPFAQIVSFTSIIGLSIIVLLLAQLILHPSIALLTLLSGILTVSLLMVPSNSDGTTLNVRAIQGGVPERGLEFNKRAQAVLDNHMKTTLRDLNNEDELIVWPENSIDIDPIKNSNVAKKMIDLSHAINTPLIAGAILDHEKLYNSTILFGRDGSIKSIYLKRYLTPFGEYIPFRTIASLASPHVDRVTDFSPGKDLIVHNLPQANIGSIICYEILNDSLVREMAVNSDLLIVHTNSATFSGSSEGEQQLAITRLRAIEARRSIVSISTTGPSAIIDARGVVDSKLEDGEIGSLSSKVPLRHEKTFAQKLGGFGPLLVLLLTFIWALTSCKYPRVAKRKGQR